MDILSRSDSDTAHIAATLAQRIAAIPNITALPVLLSGTLGMGKSVFARAFIRSICGDSAMDVPSPTFTLVQHYDAPHHTIQHFDLYRLENPEDIFELGWDDAMAESLCLIEWPERLDYMTPQNALHVTIHSADGEDTNPDTLSAAPSGFRMISLHTNIPAIAGIIKDTAL